MEAWMRQMRLVFVLLALVAFLIGGLNDDGAGSAHAYRVAGVMFGIGYLVLSLLVHCVPKPKAETKHRKVLPKKRNAV